MGCGTPRLEIRRQGASFAPSRLPGIYLFTIGAAPKLIALTTERTR
jgi:hypothetical protein